MEIKPPEYTFNLNQIRQELATEFAFVKEVTEGEWHRLHPYVLCRDYLGDVIYANEKKEEFQIYGFTSSPALQPIDKTRTTIALKFTNKKFCKKLKKGIKEILNPIELHNDIPLTTVLIVNDLEAIIIADEFWQSNIFLISLFSYLCKICILPFKKDSAWYTQDGILPANELSYRNRCMVIFPTLFDNLRQIATTKNVSGYVNDIPFGHVHNYSGFVSICHSYKQISTNTIALKLQELIK